MAVRPETFAAHAEWLARHRDVVPAETAAAAMSRRGTLPRRMTALTFDDGYADLLEGALPVLTRHRLPATVFVVSAALTEGQGVDWVDDPPDHRLRTLSVDEARSMQDGGVTFGSHSRAHLDLTRLSYEDCVADLKTSRETLEGALGRPVTLLAYPRGHHDEDVRRAAEGAGYEVAFSLPERAEPVTRFSVPRVGVYPRNGIGTLRLKTTRPYLFARTRLKR